MRQCLRLGKRVVIKVGTTVVCNANGRIALSRLGGVVQEIKGLQQTGKQIILVSGGVVAVGRQSIGLPQKINHVDRHACAAAGQDTILSTYHLLFRLTGVQCAQVLITQQDFLDQQRYTSLTQTINRLLDLGVVPIINENDVTLQPRKDHRAFGDNDMLGALVASGTDADSLLLLTDHSVVCSKAAVLAAEAGVHAVVSSECDVANIRRVFDAEEVGTFFPAQPKK